MLSLFNGRPRAVYLWGLFVSLLLPACAPVPLTLSLTPESSPLQPVTRVSSSRLFAWSPDGQEVVSDRNGLKRLHLESGKVTPLEADGVQSLAWGKPGLAVAQERDSGFEISLHDRAGVSRPIASGTGAVVSLQWFEHSLYALVVRHKHYSFGVNQQTCLLIWSADRPAEETLLADVTLKPSTPLRVGDSFPLGPALQVSPFGDEIVYSRLHDPPAFSPEYRVFVRHLDTGSERMLGSHQISGGAWRLLPDGEHLLLSDGRYYVERVSLWGESREKLFDQPAATLDASGSLIYSDGRLVQDNEVIWHLPQAPKALFSPDGSKLAILTGDYLYCVDVDGRGASPKPTAERLKLRRLRALGLIDQADYRHYVEE